MSTPCIMFASMIEIVIMPRLGTGANASRGTVQCFRAIQIIQRDRLVGWVERKRNPSSAVVAMGFVMLNPSYKFRTLNHVIGSEH